MLAIQKDRTHGGNRISHDFLRDWADEVLRYSSVASRRVSRCMRHFVLYLLLSQNDFASELDD